MLTKLLFASFIAATTAKRCGNAPPSPEARSRARIQSARFGSSNRNQTAEPAVIPTFIHVIALNETVEGGYVSEEDIKAQMDVMQADYAPQSISFKLLGFNHTINEDWAQDRDGDTMRRTLYTGGYDTLNIYIQQDVGGALGYCTIPGDFPPNSTNFFNDGCTILSRSLPGGSLEGFNLGRTATHEVGHWLDLLHTFEGACTSEGDGVADTPASLEETEGCPVGRDSCPDMPGEDPIHNFMDYSDDACMSEFTPGQGQRMHAGWQTRLAGAGKRKARG
ncbi:metalloprotease 1 precursor [Plectosphaerella plurivora]|uniref:Metalloprotease 1 n=1 Tax=Plectosphaerella plurivora TaxID=936078 RepID=A0A9P8VID3_9PEZI|nr:metalloprotease 1 precursor [Plectosphaerella plurivora]